MGIYKGNYMRFFSDLFDLTPHRTIAEKAKNFCINSELTYFEQNFIRRNQLDKEEFIRLRNLYNIKMFIGLFQIIEEKLPDSRCGITNTAFQQLYWDYYFGSGEDNGWLMWENSADKFGESVLGSQYHLLSNNVHLDFQELANRYSNAAIAFFQEHNAKLAEKIS